MRKLRPAVRDAALALGIPTPGLWPWALPGAPALHERRWRRRLERSRVVTAEQHGEQVGVGEIEQVIGCSLCGERRMQPLFRVPRDRRTRRKWSYHVVRCPSCGLLYRHPGIRPERLGDLYAGSYSKFLTGDYSKQRRRRYQLVMDAFDPVLAHGAGRRLLDYGCGTGLFLELAYERGFDPYGVDLSADSIEHARRRPSGRNAYFGAPTDVPEIAAGGFDVITLWSVLAHLATPVEDLSTLRSLLAPGGVLLIFTVNANSLQLKASGRGWGGFTKNHLKFYSPATLPLLLERSGFGAVAFRPYYGDGVESGAIVLRERMGRRLRRSVEEGNRGNMIRALAFADADGPQRWGLEADAVRL